MTVEEECTDPVAKKPLPDEGYFPRKPRARPCRDCGRPIVFSSWKGIVFVLDPALARVNEKGRRVAPWHRCMKGGTPNA